MRSRYTAFALGRVDHLHRSWHPDTRPDDLRVDPGLRWVGLEIIDTAGGSALDATGEVEFAAHHESGAGPGVLHERSRFARVDGRWVYVAGR